MIQITASVIGEKIHDGLRQTVTVHGERKEASRGISIKTISTTENFKLSSRNT